MDPNYKVNPLPESISPSLAASPKQKPIPAPLNLQIAAATNDVSIPAPLPTVRIVSPTATEKEQTPAETITIWLAQAETSTLVFVFVGATLVMYLVVGKLGLFIAGVVAGVVGRGVISSGADVDGSLGTIQPTQKEKTLGQDEKESEDNQVTLTMEEIPGETRAALKELVDLIVKDYVKHWYSPLLPTEASFPSSVQNLLNSTILHIASRLRSERPADLFLGLVTLITSHFTSLLQELQIALQVSNLPPDRAVEAVQQYISTYPNSELSQVIDPILQRQKLRLFAAQFIEAFVEKEAVQCTVVRRFMIEILAGVVLDKVLDSMVSEDAIVEWAIYLLDDPPEEQAPPSSKIPMSPITPLRSGHRREVSQAEKAMEMAMKEAEELSRMIKEEEEGKLHSELPPTEERAVEEDDHQNHEEERDHLKDIARPELPPRDPHKRNTIATFTNHYCSEMLPDGDSPAAPISSHRQSLPPQPHQQFTSFDQLPPPPVTPTLHNATVTLIDLSDSPARTLRSRPTSASFVITVEPATPHATGWLLTRRFPDFENLAATLKAAAVVGGVYNYEALPDWRAAGTTETLGGRLEQWLNLVLGEEVLSEADAVKRFLEKDVDPDKVEDGGVFGGLGKVGSVVGGGLGGLVGAGRGGLFAGRGRGGGLFGGAGRGGGLFGGNGNGGGGSGGGLFGGGAASGESKAGTGGGLFGAGDGGLFKGGWGRKSISGTTPPNFSREGSSNDLTKDEQDATKDWEKDLPTPTAYSPYESTTSTTTDRSEPSFGFNLSQNDIPSSTASNRTSSSSYRSETSSSEPSPQPQRQPTSGPAPPTHSPLTPSDLLPLLPPLQKLLTTLYALSPSSSSLRLSFLTLAISVIARPGNSVLQSFADLLNTALADYASDGYLAYTVMKIVVGLEGVDGAENKRQEGREGEKVGRRKRARELVVGGVPEKVKSVMGERAGREAVGGVWDLLVGEGGGVGEAKLGVGRGLAVGVLGGVGEGL